MIEGEIIKPIGLGVMLGLTIIDKAPCECCPRAISVED